VTDIEKEHYKRMPNRYTRSEAVQFLEMLESEFKPENMRIILASRCKHDEGNTLKGLVTGNVNQFFINFCSGLYLEDDYGRNPAAHLIFDVPLENVPLYINEPQKYLQVIARWRLTIASEGRV